jgi:hypothetical protein
MTVGERFEVRQEADRVPLRRVVRLTALTIALGASAVVVSAVLLRRSNVNAPARAQVAGAEPRPVPLEHTQIQQTERGVALRAAQRKQLSEYSWVNRDAGVARIPIERALELRAEDAR